MLAVLRRHDLVLLVLNLLEQALLAAVVGKGQLLNFLIAGFAVIEGPLQDLSLGYLPFNDLFGPFQGLL